MWEERLASGEAPKRRRVRRHLTHEAIRRANWRASLYERALRMREVLIAGQREVLAHLTPSDLRRRVRRHMTVADEREIAETVRQVTGPAFPETTRAARQSAEEEVRVRQSRRSRNDGVPELAAEP